MVEQGITIKPVKGETNILKVTMIMTKGKLWALVDALKKHPTAVGTDVLNMIVRAAVDENGKSILPTD